MALYGFYHVDWIKIIEMSKNTAEGALEQRGAVFSDDMEKSLQSPNIQVQIWTSIVTFLATR